MSETPDNAQLLDRFFDDLARDPRAPAPAGLDAETVALVRAIIVAERQPETSALLEPVRSRVWQRAWTASRTVLQERRRTFRWSRSAQSEYHPRRFPRFVTWIAAGVVAAFLLLVFSPGVRSATAQALDEIERVWLRVSGGPTGLTGLRPRPPFAVKQLGDLPPGFELFGDRYYPGPGAAGGGVRGELIRLDPKTMLPDPVVQEAVQRDRGDVPHLVLVYRSDEPQYAILFQRAARGAEALPSGAARTVGGLPAVQQHGQMLKLTWIDAGTWTELESTLPEAELFRVAEGLAPLEEATAERITPPGPSWGDRLRGMSGQVHCAGGWRPPGQRVLGDARGQQSLGSVRIEMLKNGSREWEHTAIGTNVSGRTDVLERALLALRDPSAIFQPLSYPTIITTSSSGPGGCPRPSPDVQGYIVVEVWSGQVNLGAGGQGAALKERALRALERELQR